MSLLILGGTNDALRLANSLHQSLQKIAIPIIYSLAGLVRSPTTDYQVILGGFSQNGGLDNYIKTNGIVGIVDATHPYAKNISDTAYAAALSNHIPYWQFVRPAWQQQANDNWFEYRDWDELLPMLHNKKSIFITTGQLTPLTLQSLSQKLSAKVLLRTAIKPTMASTTLRDTIQWLQAIGPFTLEDEINLMKDHAVDALVSKNSGGDATIAKLNAAKQLQLPVYLLKRPKYRRLQNNQDDAHRLFSRINACEESVIQHFKQLNSPLN